MLKKIVYTLIISFLFINGVKANTIKSIDMDIYINNEGNAHIKEVWNASLTQGTEGYKPYNDMGNSVISNFKVSDETGREYETLDKWNVSSSFSAKAYKSGINRTYNGVELCFGISNYGNKTYTLEYDISNFVTQYTDTQGIYLTLIDMEQYIGKAMVKIHSDTPFSIEENTKIWGYGYDGNINIEDGSIIMKSNSSLSTYDYMSVLVRFDTNLFNTNNISSESFDDVYAEAMSGISKEDIEFDEEENSYYENSTHKKLSVFEIILFFIVAIFYIFLTLLFNPFVWIIFILVIMSKTTNYQSSGLNFQNGKNLPNDIDMYRDIPCGKNIIYAYWLCYNYNIVSSSKLKEGLIGAILLKWLKEKKIEITETKKGLFSFKDNNYAIHFTNIGSITNQSELKLSKMLVEAAGINGILEAKEFEKWCRRHYNKIGSWFNECLNNTTEELKLKNLIIDEEKETKGLFGKTKYIKVKTVTSKVREEAIKVKGLKKFLGESSIEEKKFIEVHLWEEYLIFAELFGIAKKVQEQFSKLYPNFKGDNIMNYDTKQVFITNLASMAYSGYEKGVRAASSYSSSGYSGSSRSSGGGGHSYSSGGHSSSGSHGGGFR